MREKYKKWTEAEMTFIQNNTGIMTDLEVAASLSKMSGEDVTTNMIRRQRRKMGVKKSRGRPSKNKSGTTSINSISENSEITNS